MSEEKINTDCQRLYGMNKDDLMELRINLDAVERKSCSCDYEEEECTDCNQRRTADE